MKNIAIVTTKMVLGGTEKSLISLLESIPNDEYSMTLFIMDEGGELQEEIPRHIKVEFLHIPKNSSFYQIKQYLNNGKILKAFKTGWYSVLSSTSKNQIEWEKNHSKVLPKNNRHFDLAIAYSVPTSFPVLYVINNINAKYKVAWIHNDVEYESQIDYYKKYYLQYDKVFCVSKQSKEKFVKKFPELKDKTSVFYNILNTIKIFEAANKENVYNDSFEGLRLLTVGRLDEAKGYQLIPPILHRLISEGYNIKWYCVGEGHYRKVVEELISRHHLEDTMILLGMKENPYPYFKDCDIYIQPSRNEAYCNTITEAKLFYKPIISTNFAGATEQIINRVTGLIVKFNEQELYEAIKELILDKELRGEFSKNLIEDRFFNKTGISKLLSIIV